MDMERLVVVVTDVEQLVAAMAELALAGRVVA